MQTNNKIKKILREALGVPENISEIAQKAFDRVYSWVKKLDESDFEEGVGADVVFRVDYNIADYRFSTLKIKLGVDEHPNVVEPEMISMSVRSQSKKTDDFKLEPVKLKTVDLVMVMVVPEGFDYEELSEYFRKNENELVSNLAHEFKHVYDHFKKQYEYPAERAEYQSAIGMGFNFEPLDKFIHDIYYSSANENLVRPSEIATAIKKGQISQSKFLDFLKSSDTYLTLMRLKEFDFEDFKKQILSDKKGLNKLLRKVKMKPTQMSDEERFQAALQILYSSITNAKIANFQDILKTSFLEELLGFQGEKQKVFEKFIQRSSRFKTGEDFVKSYEKYFNFIGDKMIRKISKLYAITGK